MNISKFVVIVLFCLSCEVAFAKDFSLANYYKTTQITPQSKAILKDYERFMNIAKKLPYKKKIEAVNSYINSLNGVYDSDTDVMADYWSTRGEFLLRGGGDCEDYAITKLYTLKDLGINPKDMCLLVVKERYSGYYHMVLGIWNKNKTQPQILDNLSFKVLPLDKRVDLKVHTCINEYGYFSLNKRGKKVKKSIRFKAYEAMLKREKKEKMWISR